DHGIGRGGNLVDFALLYHQCSIRELLQSLENKASFHRQISPPKDFQKVNDEKQIEIIKVKSNQV
ncbi:MAG: hypothetical protein ABI861_12380, partial [Panacibacter sp.]